MVISKIRIKQNSWQYFNLNVGGFAIRNCRWHPPTKRVLFPVRYDRAGRRRKVILVHGVLVKRLQQLLSSGEHRTPRDRRPCNLKIGRCRVNWEPNAAHTSMTAWVIFNFSVRGFTILDCRWHPDSGSIQLPVSFREISAPRAGSRYRKIPVVCAYGAHIKRLRAALEFANADWLARRRAA